MYFLFIYVCRFSSEDVSAQNQVKASVQRKIRQSIAEEVSYDGCLLKLRQLLPKFKVTSVFNTILISISVSWT